MKVQGAEDKRNPLLGKEDPQQDQPSFSQENKGSALF